MSAMSNYLETKVFETTFLREIQRIGLRRCVSFLHTADPAEDGSGCGGIWWWVLC